MHVWQDVPGTAQNSITSDTDKRRPAPIVAGMIPFCPQSWLEVGVLANGISRYYLIDASGCQ